jgi:hypothetical protein
MQIIYAFTGAIIFVVVLPLSCDLTSLEVFLVTTLQKIYAKIIVYIDNFENFCLWISSLNCHKQAVFFSSQTPKTATEIKGFDAYWRESLI